MNGMHMLSNQVNVQNGKLTLLGYNLVMIGFQIVKFIKLNLIAEQFLHTDHWSYLQHCTDLVSEREVL